MGKKFVLNLQNLVMVIVVFKSIEIIVLDLLVNAGCILYERYNGMKIEIIWE